LTQADPRDFAVLVKTGNDVHVQFKVKGLRARFQAHFPLLEDCKACVYLLPHIRHYADRKPEHLLCVSVNGANEVINIRVVSIGLVDRSPAHAPKVFADALMDRASAVIIAHNHPADKKHGGKKDRQNHLP
jgi:DNA repair protein RadC